MNCRCERARVGRCTFTVIVKKVQRTGAIHDKLSFYVARARGLPHPTQSNSQ